MAMQGALPEPPLRIRLNYPQRFNSSLYSGLLLSWIEFVPIALQLIAPLALICHTDDYL